MSRPVEFEGLSEEFVTDVTDVIEWSTRYRELEEIEVKTAHERGEFIELLEDPVLSPILNLTPLPAGKIELLVKEVNNGTPLWRVFLSLSEGDSFFLSAYISYVMQESNPSAKDAVMMILDKLGVELDDIHDSVFYYSGRPITKMESIFNIIRSEDVDKYVLFHSDNNDTVAKIHYNRTFEINSPTLIPVIRFAKGMSRGMYFTDTDETDKIDYCGTFYYYEPGSDITLKCNKVLVAPNKFMAYLHLVGWQHMKSLMEDKLRDPGDFLDNLIGFGLEDDEEMEDFFLGKMTKKFIIEMGYKEEDELEDDGGIYQKDWSEFDKHMYAGEDWLDQHLCVQAARRGLDCVLLTTMTGKSRIVSEILDVRDREVSFSKLSTLV